MGIFDAPAQQIYGLSGSSSSSFAPYYDAAAQQAVNMGLGAAAQSFQGYGGQRYVDPYANDYNTIARQTVNANAGNYQPYFNNAQSFLNTSQGIAGATPYSSQPIGTSMWGQQQADQYMNPYIQSVIDRSSRELNRGYDIQQLNANDAATKANAFGGSRHGILNAEIERNRTQQLADVQTSGLANAYNNAQQIYTSDAARGLTAQTADETARARAAALGLQQGQLGLQGAGVAAGVGTSLQNAAGADINRYLTIGNMGTQYEQQKQDFNYNEFMRQQGYPQAQANFLTGILSGVPRTQTNTTTNQQVGAGQPSAGSQIAGLGLSGLGVLGQTGAFGANGYLTGSGGLFSGIGNSLSAAGSSLSNLFNYGTTLPGAIDFANAGTLDAVTAGTGMIFRKGGRVPKGILSYAGGGAVDLDETYLNAEDALRMNDYPEGTGPVSDSSITNTEANLLGLPVSAAIETVEARKADALRSRNANAARSYDEQLNSTLYPLKQKYGSDYIIGGKQSGSSWLAQPKLAQVGTDQQDQPSVRYNETADYPRYNPMALNVERNRRPYAGPTFYQNQEGRGINIATGEETGNSYASPIVGPFDDVSPNDIDEFGILKNPAKAWDAVTFAKQRHGLRDDLADWLTTPVGRSRQGLSGAIPLKDTAAAKATAIISGQEPVEDQDNPGGLAQLSPDRQSEGSYSDSAIPQPTDKPPAPRRQGALMPIRRSPQGGLQSVSPDRLMERSPEIPQGIAPVANQQQPVAQKPQSEEGLLESKWLPVVAAGLRLMAAKPGQSLVQNLGEAGQESIKALETQRKNKLEATKDLREERKLGLTERELNIKEPLFKSQAEYYRVRALADKFEKIGVTQDGDVIGRNIHDNKVQVLNGVKSEHFLTAKMSKEASMANAGEARAARLQIAEMENDRKKQADADRVAKGQAELSSKRDLAASQIVDRFFKPKIESGQPLTLSDYENAFVSLRQRYSDTEPFAGLKDDLVRIARNELREKAAGKSPAEQKKLLDSYNQRLKALGVE